MNIIKSSFSISGCLESKQGGRSENQDFLGFSDTPLGFLLTLCDGMGGGPGGRTASTMVVDSIIRYISGLDKTADRITAVKEAVRIADEAIIAKITENPTLSGMGTTVVILLVNEESAVVGHVGDSRLYQFRFGRKVFRTADHSMVGQLVRQGTLTEEQARLSSQSNVITRAINGRGIAIPDVEEIPFEKGDRFMLCTDGIWGAMPEPQLIRRVAKAKNITSETVKLSYDVDEIGRTNGGHHDNLTVAIIETNFNSKKRVPMGKTAIRTIALMAILLVISLVANIYMSFSNSNNLEQYKTENSNLNDTIETLKNNLAKLDATLEERSANLKDQEKKMLEDMEKKDQQIGTLQTEKTTLEAEVKNLKGQIEELKKAKPQASAQTKPAAKATTASSTSAKNNPFGSAIKSIENWLKDGSKAGLIKADDIADLIKKIKKINGDNGKKQKAINALDNAKKQFNAKADANTKVTNQHRYLNVAKEALQ